MSELIKVIEFYSGIGGMHFALKESCLDFEVEAAADINTTANKIYQHNFPSTKMITKCIEALTVKDLDRLGASMLVMSPPCQPFCRVGKQRDAADQRTKSLLHLLNLLPRLKKPLDYILVENVKGFDTSESRQLLLNTLRHMRYHVQEFLLSPVQFGVPNSRLRYYLLARRQPFAFPAQPEFMTDLPECMTPYLVYRRPTPKDTHTPDAGSGSPTARTPDAGSGPPTAHTPDAGSGSPTAHTPDAGSGSPTAHTPDAGCGSPTAHTPDAGSGSLTTHTTHAQYWCTLEKHVEDSQTAGQDSQTAGQDSQTAGQDSQTAGQDATDCRCIICDTNVQSDNNSAGNVTGNELRNGLNIDSTQSRTNEQENEQNCDNQSDVGLQNGTEGVVQLHSSLDRSSHQTNTVLQNVKENIDQSQPSIQQSANQSESAMQNEANSFDSDDLADSQAEIPLYEKYKHVCGELGEFLEKRSDVEMERYLIPEKFFRLFWVLDIVNSGSRNSCCFTKRYAHHIEGSGSVIEMNTNDSKDLSHYKEKHVYDVTVHEAVRRRKLRFFSPREIANLMCFPECFNIPAEMNDIQMYRVLGNSLNVHVVAVLLRLLTLERNETV